MLKIHKDLLDFVRPSPHSLFSPSSAERWLNGCSYSVNATKNIPQEDSKYSLEGTLAHSVCEAVFREQFAMVPFPHDLAMQMLSYNSQEMLDCAHGYVEVIASWLSNKAVIGDVIWYGLERGIPVFPEEGCFGTADCLIIGTKGAVVIDYKHGVGKNVKADTPQLKVYAAGVARYLLDVPADYLIHACVYQPRTDRSPKETSYDMPTLNQYLGAIWGAIQASKQPNLSPVEGNHCFWCPAKRTKDTKLMCPVIKDKPMQLAKENFGKFLADMNAPIDSLDAPNPKRDEAIIKLRALYPMIKQVVEHSEEEFKMRLEQGEVIPGVRLVDVMGKRTLNADSDVEAARMIKERFPQVDPLKLIPATSKLKTITEIEKEIGKNKLDSLCVKKITKKVDILDEKMRNILGEMSAYAEMINNGTAEE